MSLCVMRQAGMAAKVSPSEGEAASQRDMTTKSGSRRGVMSSLRDMTGTSRHSVESGAQRSRRLAKREISGQGMVRL